MKPIAMLSIAATLFAAAVAPSYAADVGVSVTIGEPNFYGRIDIGNFPQPRIILPEPVIIVPAPVAVVRAPVYLRVPPGHQKKWGKHCHEYNACGDRVYFVDDGWYSDVYAPAWREKHGRGGGKNKGGGKGEGKSKGEGKKHGKGDKHGH